MSLPDASKCKHHPDRDGIGVCIRCRTVICSECSTKIDGINHCTHCIRRLRWEQRPRKRWTDRTIKTEFLTLVLYATTASFILYLILRAVLVPS